MIAVTEESYNYALSVLRTVGGDQCLCAATALQQDARPIPPTDARKLQESIFILATNEIIYRKALEGLTQHLSSEATTEVDSEKIRHARTLLARP